MTLSELIEKYPKIFQQYEGNPGMVNWSGIPKEIEREQIENETYNK